MGRERWSARAMLIGELFLEQTQVGTDLVPPVEGLQRLRIEPEFGGDDRYTGRHLLRVEVAFDTADDAPLADEVVFERVKHLVGTLAAAASLDIGRPVRFTELFVTRQLADDPPTFRRIGGIAEAAESVPPAPLSVRLLAGAMDPTLERAVRWWARGVASSDAVDRLGAFNNALDLMAGTLEGVPGRTRTCAHCGAVENIDPGLRERVVYFLAKYGVDEPRAKAIYESRVDLSHARTDLIEGDLQRYRSDARIVATAVRAGLADALGMTLTPEPGRLPFDFESGLLVLDYIGGPDNEPSY